MQDMLTKEVPYGERVRTAPVDQYDYASIFPHAPSSVVDQDIMSTIAARQRSGVWSSPFNDKKMVIDRTSSPGGIDDTATITTQVVLKAKLLDQLSSFQQLSKMERQQLLLDVKKLLGEKENKSNDRQRSRGSSGKTINNDEGTMFSTDEDQTQFSLDETQFTANEDNQTQFSAADQTQFTMSNDDQESQFSSDSQSLLSLIDNIFSCKSHDQRRGDSGRRRRERTVSWSHGGSVDYDEGYGENCTLSMCDSFLSCLICDGKSDAVEMAARERTNDRRGSRKGSRERKHNEEKQRHFVAYRKSPFVMDESVIYSGDSNNGGTVNDDSSLHDQQSSLLSGWNEATSPDKVDPSLGVTTTLMSMNGKKAVDNSATRVEKHNLQQNDVDLVDKCICVVVEQGTKRASHDSSIPTMPISNPSSTSPRSIPSKIDNSTMGPTKFNLTAAETASLATPKEKTRQASNEIIEINNPVTTTIRAASPTESIDDIISQTEQLSSGKISLREELDSKTSSLVPAITPKKPWKEYAPPTTGLKYYSNGVIATWERPDDSSNGIIASSSMSAIELQLKNDKKQLLLDSMATNYGRFKLIRVRVGMKSFFKRKK